MVKRAAQVEGLPIHINRESAVTLPQQIAEQFRVAVRCGRLPSGTRLPATRRLACALGVSRNTVLLAYEDLVSEGIIGGRVGAGSYVVDGFRCIWFTDPDGNELILRVRTRLPQLSRSHPVMPAHGSAASRTPQTQRSQM